MPPSTSLWLRMDHRVALLTVLAGAGLAVAGGIGAWSHVSPEFSPAEVIEWEERSFQRETPYRLVEVDGRKAVHARCDDATASGLYYRKEIDLERTPVLEWSWRVEETYTDLDETTRAGDDFPARIYLIEEHRLLRWRTRGLNYVWASEQPKGTDWPNPYASAVHMIAVRSGPPAESGQWFTERRNVRDDFRTFHGRDLEKINVVAIMTDCDDTGQEAEAWYGALRFVEE